MCNLDFVGTMFVLKFVSICVLVVSSSQVSTHCLHKPWRWVEQNYKIKAVDFTSHYWVSRWNSCPGYTGGGNPNVITH